MRHAADHGDRRGSRSDRHRGRRPRAALDVQGPAPGVDRAPRDTQLPRDQECALRRGRRDRFIERAEIVQEKGTDRSRFFRGQVDKYTWQDIGSSYLLSEVGAAFLYAQLEFAEAITAERLGIWERYHEAFADLEADGLLRRPSVPDGCQHSGHLYYLLLNTTAERDAVIAGLAERGVHAVFHYVPLHESPAGQRLGRSAGSIDITPSVSGRLVRLPLWSGLGEERTEVVVDAVLDTVSRLARYAPAV
jgi:dTDP-4-amino-4,6-dideoxygalactose transaminase